MPDSWLRHDWRQWRFDSNNSLQSASCVTYSTFDENGNWEWNRVLFSENYSCPSSTLKILKWTSWEVTFYYVDHWNSNSCVCKPPRRMFSLKGYVYPEWVCVTKGICEIKSWVCWFSDIKKNIDAPFGCLYFLRYFFCHQVVHHSI